MKIRTTSGAAVKRHLPIAGEDDEKPSGLVEAPPSLIRLVEDVLAQRNQKLNFFRPSMLHGCDRANVFHYKNAPWSPQQHDPRLHRILDNGTAIHEVMQRYLADHREWWFAPEARAYVKIAGAWVRGSCDGVLIRRKDMYKVGVEIKSINHDEFMKLTKPKSDHVHQARIYMKLHGLQWIVVLYWDKNNQNLKEFPVRASKTDWAEIKERIAYLKGFIDRKELPKYDPSTCNPDWCSFTEFCRKKGAPI